MAAANTEQKNPMQWATFEHFGMRYTEHYRYLMVHLNVPVIYIQRWWRQRGHARKKIYPIKRNVKEGQDRNICKYQTVRDSAVRLKGKGDFLSRHFCAVEKLDGTNLGVRSGDGAVFGRRYRVTEDTYQNVPLKGTIPSAKQVTAIKETMVGDAGGNSIELMLYGELMCNPNKFDYSQRSMGHRFYCFGAVLDAGLEAEQRNSVFAELREKGLVPFDSGNGRIRVVMNDAFGKLIRQHGVDSAPMMDEGPLRELWFRVKDTLLKDGMEGVVLSGDDGALYKWKTSVEDESKTHQQLSSLLKDHSKLILELVGVDIPLVLSLIDVSQKKPENETSINRVKRGSKKDVKKKDKKPNVGVYDNITMQHAIVSAMSKYDSLEAYFAKGERDTILACLQLEVIEDLGASTTKEVKFIQKTISKEVGLAFGRWTGRISAGSKKNKRRY